MDSRQTVKTITRHTCFNKKEENINVDLLIMNKYIVVIIQWKNRWNVFTCRSWDTTAAHISITIWWKHIFGLRECWVELSALIPYWQWQHHTAAVNLLFHLTPKMFHWTEIWWLRRPLEYTGLGSFQVCDMVWYPAGSSHQMMRTL